MTHGPAVLANGEGPEVEEDAEDEAYDEDSSDESTAGPIACTVCDAEEDCPHLLARFDDSNGCLESGALEARLGAFEAVLHAAFWPRFSAANAGATVWRDDDLQAVWDECSETSVGTTEADFDVSGDAFNTLLKRALEENGGEEYPGPSPSESDLPGMDISVSVYFSAKPDKTLDAALRWLERLVTKAGRAPRPVTRKKPVATKRGPQRDVPPRRRRGPATRGPTKTRGAPGKPRG